MADSRVGTLPAHTELAGLNTLTDVRAHVGCGDRLWQSVTDQLGDPGDNILLVAALPQHVLIQACGNAESTPGVGLTPFQATHVGLVWRICRKIVHMRAGQPEGDFTDLDPWTPSTPSTAVVTSSAPASTGHSVKERVLKMSSLVDQADDSELLPPEKSMVDGWINNYIVIMGAAPQEEEEPTESQLAGLHKRACTLGQAPYVDFAVWLPFGRRTQKSQKFRLYQPLGDGSFLMRELPGPQNLQQWLVCWRVFKCAALMLKISSLASLQLYEKTVARLVLQWPQAWGLIYTAEDKGRAEKLEKIRRSLMIDKSQGKALPSDWDEAMPWTTCFRMLATDEEYWSEQVRHPATSWLAAGGRGAPMAPAEAIAGQHLPGGVAAVEPELEDKSVRRKQSNRDKRQARAKRLRADREELSQWRSSSTRTSNAPKPEDHQQKGGGKGKGKSKDNTGAQICFSYATGVGLCGS